MTNAIAFLAITAPLASIVLDGALWPRFTNKKVGGIRFIGFGRLRLSFCVARA